MPMNNLSHYNVKNHNNRTLDLILSNVRGVKVIRCDSPLCRPDPHHPVREVNILFCWKSKISSKQFATHNFKKAN